MAAVPELDTALQGCHTRGTESLPSLQAAFLFGAAPVPRWKTLSPPAPALFFLRFTSSFSFSGGGGVIVVDYGFCRMVNTFISPNGKRKIEKN